MLNGSTSALNLFLFRFFYCFSLAIAVQDRASYFWQQREFGLFRGLLFLLPFQGEQTTEVQYLAAKWILVLLLVLLACGVAPRVTALLSLLSYLNLFLPVNIRLEPFDDNIVVFNLLILIFAPIGGWRSFLAKNPLSYTLPSLSLIHI